MKMNKLVVGMAMATLAIVAIPAFAQTAPSASACRGATPGCGGRLSSASTELDESRSGVARMTEGTGFAL